ncbi:MAG TPA: NADH-quinone oxidoreductase subunit A [Polyangia bacterium]
MRFHFATVLVFLLVACGFLVITLTLGRLLRPATPSPEKAAVYECGEQAVGGGWFNFNPRFYTVALIFLIFDIEVAFTYPVATAFRHWLSTGRGLIAFLEIAGFIAVLAFGLAYVWRRGDLEWIRGLGGSNDRRTND